MIQQNNSWAAKRSFKKMFSNDEQKFGFSRKLNKLNRANSGSKQHKDKIKLPRAEADLNCRALKHKNNKVARKINSNF